MADRGPAGSPVTVVLDGEAISVLSAFPGVSPRLERIPWSQVEAYGLEEGRPDRPGGLTLLTTVEPYFSWISSGAEGLPVLLDQLHGRQGAGLPPAELLARIEALQRSAVDERLRRDSLADAARIRAAFDAAGPALGPRLELDVLSLAAGRPEAIAALLEQTVVDSRDVMAAAERRRSSAPPGSEGRSP